MEKEATEMISGVKLGPGSSHGHLKVCQVNPIREGDGKVDEGVGLEITLISPPGHEDKHQGRQKGS